jgi:hypothetical protein
MGRVLEPPRAETYLVYSNELPGAALTFALGAIVFGVGYSLACRFLVGLSNLYLWHWVSGYCDGGGVWQIGEKDGTMSTACTDAECGTVDVKTLLLWSQDDLPISACPCMCACVYKDPNGGHSSVGQHMLHYCCCTVPLLLITPCII